MKHEFESWTVQQFVEQRRIRKRRNWRSLFVLGVVASQLALVTWNHFHLHHFSRDREGRTFATFSSGGVMTMSTMRPFYDKVCMEELVTDAAQNLALFNAVKTWEAVLRRPIPLPKFTRNDCGQPCPQSIACANLTEYSITVVNIDKDMDAETILLHEVAHLLGVPHIDGDALMGDGYDVDPKAAGHRVLWPTPAAIALAKLVKP